MRAAHDCQEMFQRGKYFGPAKRTRLNVSPHREFTSCRALCASISRLSTNHLFKTRIGKDDEQRSTRHAGPWAGRPGPGQATGEEGEGHSKATR